MQANRLEPRSGPAYVGPNFGPACLQLCKILIYQYPRKALTTTIKPLNSPHSKDKWWEFFETDGTLMQVLSVLLFSYYFYKGATHP